MAPLVEAGAHPLQALMSLHVIFSMSHRSAGASDALTRMYQPRNEAEREIMVVSYHWQIDMNINR